MKKYTMIVTGGLGFIGSNFILYMLSKYKSLYIINIDNASYCANKYNVHPVRNNPNYRFAQGNINDKKLLNSLFSYFDVDFVVNFAAQTHVDRSIDNGSIFFRSNLCGLNSLLEVANEYFIKRMIHVSTDEVFGSIRKGKFKENSKLCPGNPYSASKASAELLRNVYKTIPMIIVRPCNNFGPRQYPEKLIPLFIMRLLGNQKVPLYGKGDNRREWMFVADTCYAIDVIINKGLIGESYNVGSGVELTNYKLTRYLLSLMNKSKDMIDFVTDRPGHDFRYRLDSNKIRQLGWKPQMKFKEGIVKTVEWYKRILLRR